MRSRSELETQLTIFKQLQTMARQSYRAACEAETAALRSKLEAEKTVAELKVRIELVEQELGIEEQQREIDEWELRESAKADQGDSLYKQAREERFA